MKTNRLVARGIWQSPHDRQMQVWIALGLYLAGTAILSGLLLVRVRGVFVLLETALNCTFISILVYGQLNRPKLHLLRTFVSAAAAAGILWILSFSSIIQGLAESLFYALAYKRLGIIERGLVFALFSFSYVGLLFVCFQSFWKKRLLGNNDALFNGFIVGLLFSLFIATGELANRGENSFLQQYSVFATVIMTFQIGCVTAGLFFLLKVGQGTTKRNEVTVLSIVWCTGWFFLTVVLSRTDGSQVTNGLLSALAIVICITTLYLLYNGEGKLTAALEEK